MNKKIKFRNIAFIPARIGSKGVKKKNIKLLDNKPLISYSIESAILSNCFDEIWVSSDSIEVKKIIEKYEKVSFIRRSKKLSNDKSLISKAIEDFDKKLNFKNTDRLWLLQATCPFRSKNDIIKVNKYIFKFDYFSLFSIRNVGDSHPARMYTKSNNKVVPIHKQLQSVRRQDLNPTFIRDGYFYIASFNLLRRNNYSFFHNNSYKFNLKKSFYVNIDENIDFKFAEYLKINEKNYLN